ncbi:MAG: UDP-GlcNAc:undecaprenyl-phosphate/decaprenyl-phosphate GlcNAc-phosphate transferase [Clostridia bacterium]|nr:UDP-GlcNAc:undecaprenyl-phosphate/decaprenyl-phosphate GlcNAc-phosphate transferase [Clostridia bacterium]
MNLLPVLLAFTVAFISTPLVSRLALKIGAVDAPGGRKIHYTAMPRLGGLAIYAGFMVAALLSGSLGPQTYGLLVGGTLIFIIGLLDDLFGLNAWTKLLGQLSAAGILVFCGIRVEYLTNPFDGLFFLGKFMLPVTILWVVGVTNALNLVDGLDGLAAGTSIIAAASIAVITWLEGETGVSLLALALACAALGFLPHNFYPARIFMGDSGSLFLGFNLAVLSTMGLAKSATAISLFIPVVILGLPICDTFFAIIRRFLNGKSIFEPDKGHLHHRLLACGLTQRQAVLAIYAVDFCLAGSAVLLTRLTNAQGVIILVVLAVLILLGANRLGVMGRPISILRQKPRRHFFNL